MKKMFLGLLSVFIFSVSPAQQAVLMIKTGSGAFYLEHKAQPHEGLFPIGRFYNVHPRHIASFNKLDFNKGLAIGQVLKIPLTDTNFNQKSKDGLPVYYVTKEKETLTNISIKNKFVSMINLREWNDLSSENIPANTKLIVGYLTGSAGKDSNPTVAEDKKESSPPVVVEKKEPEVKKANVEVIKEEPKKTETEIKKEVPPTVKEEPKKTIPADVTIEEKPAESNGGFFQAHFNEQIKQTPVTKEQALASSVFKSANGWKDAKYYLLINGVEPGTIVKITNPVNNKITYAKVLYGMEGIRQNEGLDMRISDAAAASLSISETDKFILKINY
jgi:LysM domain